MSETMHTATFSIRTFCAKNAIRWTHQPTQLIPAVSQLYPSASSCCSVTGAAVPFRLCTPAMLVALGAFPSASDMETMEPQQQAAK